MQRSSQAGTTRRGEDAQKAASHRVAGSGAELDHEAPPGTPRWVKVFGIVAIVLLLLFVGLHLTGNAPTHVPPGIGAQHGMQSP